MNSQDSADLFDTSSGMFLLTNQHNLRLYLSEGLFAPSCIVEHGIYHSEVMSEDPGRLILFEGHAPAGLIEIVISEDPDTTFPVILEVEVDEISSSFMPSGDGHVFWAPAEVISTASMKRMHFRSLENRTMFLSTPFSNLADLGSLSEVSPDLFGNRDAALEELLDWYGKLESVSSSVTKVAGNGSLLGAILMADAAARATGRDSSQWTRFSDWMGGEGDAFLAPEVNHSLDAISDETENAVFRVVCRHLVELDPRAGWDPTRAIDLISSDLSELDESLPQTLHLGKMKSILRGDQPFEGLKPGGSIIGKSLLLFLLRWEPDRLLSWSSEETKATPQEFETAAFFSGLACGYQHLPASLRDPGLESRLLKERVKAINSFLIKKVKAKKTDTFNLVESLEDQLERLKQALAKGDKKLIKRVVVFCEKAGWNDCLMSIVSPTEDPGDGIRIVQVTLKRKKVPAVQMPGRVTVETRLDLDGLVARLDHPKTTDKVLKALCAKAVED